MVEELDYAIEQVTDFAQAQKDSLVEFENEIRPGMHMTTHHSSGLLRLLCTGRPLPLPDIGGYVGHSGQGGRC